MSNKTSPDNSEHDLASISTGIKQPKFLKLWSEMTTCKLDEKKWQASNNQVHSPSSSATNDEMTLSQQSSCRGLYKRITDLMQDGYIAYKTKELQNQAPNNEAAQQRTQQQHDHHFSPSTPREKQDKEL